MTATTWTTQRGASALWAILRDTPEGAATYLDGASAAELEVLLDAATKLVTLLEDALERLEDGDAGKGEPLPPPY